MSSFYTGVITTAQPAQPSELRPLSFLDGLVRYSPGGMTPLLNMSADMPKGKATNMTHGFFAKSMTFKRTTVATTVNSSATTVTVADGTQGNAGDMFMDSATDENFIIVGVNGNDWTIRRQVGTVAASALTSGDELLYIGCAFEQASNRPQPVALKMDYVSNYTQIFRTSWAVSGTAAAIPQLAGEGEVAENRADCGFMHGVAMELALLFGQKYIGTKDGRPFHTMQGIIPTIMESAPGNIFSAGGTTNWTQLATALDATLNVVAGAKSNNTRLVLCGGNAISVITNIARLNSDMQITSDTTKWGLRIRILTTPRGEFVLMEHSLFNSFGMDHAWSRMALVLDMSQFSLDYLRETTHKAYGEGGSAADDGQDAVGGTLTTELTLSMKNPAACGLLLNLQAAAAG